MFVYIHISASTHLYCNLNICNFTCSSSYNCLPLRHVLFPCVCVCVSLSLHTYVYIYMYIYIYIYIYIYTYTYIYIYIYICIYIYIYMVTTPRGGHVLSCLLSSVTKIIVRCLNPAP